MKLSEDVTIVDCLRRRAEEQPDRTVFHLIVDEFFSGDMSVGPAITYRELSRHAAALAVTLLEQLQPGDRVLLTFASGLEFMPAFYGCLFAGVVPVPVYPPVRGLQADPLEGLRRIVKDCRPKAAVTGGKAGSGIIELAMRDAELSSLSWLTTDAIHPEIGSNWQKPDISPHSLALLQYTSGSTGTPRGVAVTHENIMSNNQLIQRAFHHRSAVSPQRGVCWLPFHHDMGLIGNVLHPVYADIPVHFLTPLDFVRRPYKWLQAISMLGPVTSGGPGFAYDLCVQKISDEQKRLLDLSRWRIAYVGADKVHAHTIRAFVEAFAPCGLNPESLYPCYGLAEATLFVTGGDWNTAPVIRRFRQTQDRVTPVESAVMGDEKDDANRSAADHGRELVGCGRVWSEHDVLVVDPETRKRRDEEQIGEIWVSGVSVADGYWNQPQVTRQMFGAQIADESDCSWLRTGDLGFFSEGQLFVTGRLKDVIIIRGRNYHPADIEAVVAAQHAAFGAESTAAIGREINGEERLVILQEVARRTSGFSPAEAGKRIRQRIAEEFQIQASEIMFLTRGSLPKTSSGKLRRFACRELYEAGALPAWKGSVD